MKIKLLSTFILCLTFMISSKAQNTLEVKIFEDVDGNGLEDAGEPFISGVTITELELYQDVNNNGAIDGFDVLFTHDNGIAGIYTFGAGGTLPDDDYILLYNEAGGPGSYYVTKLVNGVGALDDDNDLDPFTNTAGFGLTGGVTETLIDLGLVIAGNIGSYTWHDENGNGLQDPGEPDLDGVDITLLDAMTMIPVVNDIDNLPLTNPTTSAGGGMYTFDNLPPGQYIVEFSVPAPSPDPWYPTMYTADDDATDVLDDNDANNDSSSPNYLQSHTVILLSDETDEEDKIDAGFFQAATIGDMVWEDVNGDGIQDPGEPGIDGVTVSLFDDLGAPAIGADGVPVLDVVTAGGGFYMFDLVAPGDYQVQFNLPAPVGGIPWYPTEFDPSHTDANDPDIDSDANNDPTDAANYLKSHVINIISAETDEELRIDAGFWLPARVGNMVFCDENGNGIDDDGVGGVDGVDVRLIDTGTGLTAQDADGIDLTTTTAGGGMYMFELVPPGFYELEFSFTAATPDPPFVFTLQNDPLGVGGGADLDDSDVDPNDGRTEEFEITSQDVEEELKWDAGCYQVINIFGTIWIEDDMNNQYDGEMGPGNVFLEIFNADDDTKVDETFSNAGEYEFIGLPPGNYYISFDVTGTPLESATACPGQNDANDMVDNDDNGSDDIIVFTTPFECLSNCDPSTPPEIFYVDFCYFFDCNEQNMLASTACSNIQDIDIICDISILGTFCNLMPTGNSPGNQPSPLCPDGGGPHNMSWFAFVAYDGDYSVQVTPTGCSGSTTGMEGVQIGLYTDCTFTESVYCDPACSTNPVSFDSDILEAGQTYYFFIDGCSGSVCSYEVEIIGNPLPPNLLPLCVAIEDPTTGDLVCEDATYCPDAVVNFVATDFDLTVDFTWTVNAISGGPYTGDPNPMSMDENLPLDFPNEGVYEICLTQVSNGCSAQTWNGNECRQITIEGIDDEVFDPVTVCVVEDFTDPSTLMPMDPNGDGTIGWQGGNTFMEGTNMFTVTTAEGCEYDQEFDLELFPESDQGLFEQTVCLEDLPLMVDALQINEISFGGMLEFTLQDYLLANETDVNGCDSIIDISIEVLNIVNGTLSQGTCLPGQGVIMNFDYDVTLSTDISNYTIEWFDPMGNPLPDDQWMEMDPTDNLAPFDIGGGEYTLVITVIKNGVTCTFNYSIDIDIDSLLPPTPEISAPGLDVCEADSIVTYTAINFGMDVFGFTWNWPNDVASADISGADGEVLTINWSGSNGGTVSLITENGCGESELVDIEINVIPQPTPSFSFINEVCIDSCTTIEFTGDAATVGNYTWDFDGGIEDNGTGSVGPGPHCVYWSTAGDRTITLSYIDTSGCESLITTEVVSVIAPLDPPVPNCISQLGEVTFSWDILPGTDTTDYSVIVTTGQTGTQDGNTFTVDGLATNEQVDITITILTNDACVEVSTTASCIAQDCVPPDVSISAPGDVVSYCLDGSDQSFDLIENLPMGVMGSGVFMGSGITDTLAGTFNPDSAAVGNNTVFYTFFTDDGCISPAQLVIEVLETPIASFTPDVDTICITDQFNLTYDGTANVNDLSWDYGVDGTGTDGQMPVVTYTSAGEKTIRLIVTKDGCESESFVTNVFVQPELPPIEVFCASQEIDQVSFNWSDVPGATGYEVTVNGGSPFITTDTDYSETGLNPDDEVILIVTVLTDSKCPGSTSTDTCIAMSCPTFTFDIPQPVIPICEDGNNALVTLDATAMGGMGGGTYTWSGTNVTGDQFDPNGLAEGSYTLRVTYEEDSCEGSDSVRVDITTVPEASFSVDNTTICIGDTVNLLYTGSQLMNQQITWTADETVMSGTNQDEYFVVFNSEGTFDIQLDVENGACTTAPANQTITVEPELVFDMIDCVPDLDQIEFSWTAVDCATEYEVFINGTSQGTQTTTTFTVMDLDVNEEVMIEVIAVSGCACGNVAATRMCETNDCTQVDLNLSTMDGVTDFCLTADLGTVEIIAEAIGTQGNGTFTWSGPGVDQDGVFDPAVAGVGTHTIFYDFLESAGCPFTDSITFTINELPEVSLSAAEITCYDQSTTTLEVTPTGGSGNYTITLNGAAGDLMNDVGAGQFDVVVTDDNQCSATSSITISVPAEPMIAISGNADLILGDSSSYSISSLPFDAVTVDSVVWTANGAEICNDPGCFSIGTQTPTVNTDYEVTVYFNNGCSVTALLPVTVTEIEPPSIVEIPNIISPNDDGSNDEWKIVTNDEDVIINSISIFDRWGNQVWGFEGPFQALNNNVVWDGKFNGETLQPGVYVYYIDLIQNERNRIRSGDITIIN